MQLASPRTTARRGRAGGTPATYFYGLPSVSIPGEKNINSVGSSLERLKRGTGTQYPPVFLNWYMYSCAARACVCVSGLPRSPVPGARMPDVLVFEALNRLCVPCVGPARACVLSAVEICVCPGSPRCLFTGRSNCNDRYAAVCGPRTFHDAFSTHVLRGLLRLRLSPAAPWTTTRTTTPRRGLLVDPSHRMRSRITRFLTAVR